MKEADHVLVSDLRTVRAALAVLSDVVPANNPSVPADEYALVMRTLYRWTETMSKRLQGKVR